ncbi:acylphosphatase-1 [Folsomia candida]|uniref:Acylphosphatase n=1 Tax=Folsomia candida TaxID=158441 RepID=A0A226D9R2_FOLCA|nr:acylphosphatase-1 [Folsomia candida]OXA41880.1 Acylphosphatase-1 [Folsomia candida]
MNSNPSKSKPSVTRTSLTSQRGSLPSTTTGGLVSIDFEIRGKVQGVHFRKYTQRKATELRLRGWCKNTEHGTVAGRMEGERLQIDMMKDWLKRVGSPKSRIDGADFKTAKAISSFSYGDFQIIK